MRLSLKLNGSQLPIALALHVLAPGGPASAAPGELPCTLERRVAAMGTELVWTVEAAGRAEALRASETVLGAVESAEARLSTWRPDTALAALNRAPVGEWVALEADLERDLAGALAAARATRGAFDPCVGALVAAWDLRGAGRIPDAAQVAIALEGVGALELRPGAARRLHAQAIVEEGGFGKGAALDAALEALSHTEADRMQLDFGGQIAWYQRGRPTERGVDIAHPSDRARVVCSLNTLLASASTSGNGERARLVAGRIVGHILDARDGSMAHSRGSVTVLASSALLADALSTGLCVLGPEEGLRAVQELPEVEAVFVEELADGRLRVHATERARRRISRLDPHAELAPQPRISTPSPVPVR